MCHVSGPVIHISVCEPLPLPELHLQTLNLMRCSILGYRSGARGSPGAVQQISNLAVNTCRITVKRDIQERKKGTIITEMIRLFVVRSAPRLNIFIRFEGYLIDGVRKDNNTSDWKAFQIELREVGWVSSFRCREALCRL